jgi:hypothetical protein
MLTAREEYSLRSFDGRSTKTAAFDKAIRIYCDTTGGGVKTDASQIVYWAERDKEFSRGGDRVYVLGLLRDREIVGFALAFYIFEQRLFVVDHIAITPSVRSMTAFEKFCELIRQHVKSEALYVDYFVAEVSADVNEGDPLLNFETLTRLLQIVGFRVVETPYLTPSAERIPPYRPVKAKLMLHSIAETKMSGAKLLGIVRSMHDGLYKNWYRSFAKDFEKYCSHLREIADLVERDIGNKEYVMLNGHPPFRSDIVINDLPQRPIVVAFFIVLAVALALAVAVAASWIGIGLYSVVSGAIAVAICTVVVLAIWYDGAAKLVKYGISALVSFSGKQK